MRVSCVKDETLSFIYEVLDANFKMWNIKLSIIYIYKSEESFSNLKYRILSTSYMKVWAQNNLQKM